MDRKSSGGVSRQSYGPDRTPNSIFPTLDFPYTSQTERPFSKRLRHNMKSSWDAYLQRQMKKPGVKRAFQQETKVLAHQRLAPPAPIALCPALTDAPPKASIRCCRSKASLTTR